MKSEMTASTAMPPPAMRIPVCPVARKVALRPRFESSRSMARAVNILPQEQSVPTVSRRRPLRGFPWPTSSSTSG